VEHPGGAGDLGDVRPERPYLYQSTLHGIDVYDVSVPERPRLVGSEPMAFFQNEAVSMGVANSREDGTTFVTVGLDLYGAGIMESGPDAQISPAPTSTSST
jgi:hypothetical protein